MVDSNKSAATTKRAFVTGWPIEHSRSPLIHQHWLQHHQIDGTYQKIATPVEKFPDWITRLEDHGFVGGNITIPHKEAASKLVDHSDGTARQIGAVNTVWTEGGKLFGTNTDAYGFLANLDDKAPGWDKDASSKTSLVLGAGGAARAVVYALLERGFERIIIANRTHSRAEALATGFGLSCQAIPLEKTTEHLPKTSVLVNTTALGMSGNSLSDGTDLPVDVSLLPDTALVTDIVYTPLMTPLLNAAHEEGLSIVDGLGMLLHQAVPGFEKWFGQRPKVTRQLRNIILRDLGENSETLFFGLTGSIGMGKSTTANLFREAGIPVHDSDAIVHQLYEGEAVPLVDAEFPGTAVDGKIDRTRLSDYVVGDEEAMKRLEAIVHPLVHREELAFREEIAAQGHALAILDAPLLYEMGTDQRVDGIIVVSAPFEVQRERVLDRPGMTKEKFETILARQVPDSEKRQRADFVIDTSKGVDAARQSVLDIIKTISSGESDYA